MNSRYIFLPLVFFIVVHNSYAKTEIGDLGPNRSIYSQLEESDSVMTGTIDSIKSRVHPISEEINYKYILSDAFTVESSGLVPIKKKVKLRFYGGVLGNNEVRGEKNFENLIGRRVIAFVRGNGKTQNPLVGNNGMLFVGDDGGITTIHGFKLLGVGDKGEPLTAEGYNGCDLNDVGQMSGTFNDPNDPSGSRNLTRGELLAEVQAFNCPDNKGTWYRGRDLPANLRNPIEIDGLITLLSKHKKNIGLPMSDHAKLTSPSEESLHPNYSRAKEMSAEEINVWIEMLDNGVPLSSQHMKMLQKILRIRGESIPERHLHLLDKNNIKKEK